MNRTIVKQIGNVAGYLIVPLVIASLIYLITYRRFDLPIIVALIALAVCVIVFTVLNPNTVAKAFGGRIVRSWLTTAVTIAAVVGILVLVNILTSRVPVQVDNTAAKQFTISDQSIRAIERINNPVTVSIFFSSQTASLRDNAIDQLKAYQGRTEKITVNQYDVNSAAGLGKARELNITTDPLIVFQGGTRREDVTSVDEQSFTRALLRLQQTVDKRVYFTTGHGERGITVNTQPNQEGMSDASTAMTNNNYKVETVNLATNTDSKGQPVTLNPSTDIIVVAAPTTPFSDADKQRLVGFLRQGGRAMFLQDPTNFLATQSKNNVNSMLQEWNGLKFDDGIVVETNPQAASSSNPLILFPQPQEGSDILRGVSNAIPFVMEFATAVNPGTNQAGFTPLYASTQQSYLKTSVEQIRGNQFNFTQGTDKIGPISVAASFETDAKEATPTNLAVPGGSDTRKTRLVLFSSVSWATDAQGGIGLLSSGATNNYTVFVNAINWLAEEKDAVVIAPKTPDSKPFVINQSQDTFIFYSSFLGLPLIVFFIGLVVWWRRR